MFRRPQGYTRTYTLSPYTTLFRSQPARRHSSACSPVRAVVLSRLDAVDALGQGHDDSLRAANVCHAPHVLVGAHSADQSEAICGEPVDGGRKVVDLEAIGRAHV